MKEFISDQRREVLPRGLPYRGCPMCQRPVYWQYSEHDMDPKVYGLGVPWCSRHGAQKGWVVITGEALQSEFLTGGFVADSKEWGSSGG